MRRRALTGGANMKDMKELKMLISRLHENDSAIIRQLCAVIYRYLERRGRA